MDVLVSDDQKGGQGMKAIIYLKENETVLDIVNGDGKLIDRYCIESFEIGEEKEK